MIEPDEIYMMLAIHYAQQAAREGDYAIGAVIVDTYGNVIAGSGNKVRIDQDPTAHAEISTIRKAASLFGKRHLDDCVLYTTHEPCPMCTGAILMSRLQGLVFGAELSDMKAYAEREGDEEFTWRTIDISCSEIIARCPTGLNIIHGFMKAECKELFHQDILPF